MAVFRYELTVDTSTVPPTIAAKPATGPAPAVKGWRVVGRFLTDPLGVQHIPVGVEQRLEHVDWIPDGPTVLEQIGMTCANTTRILPNYRGSNGLKPAEIDAAIAAGLNAGMFIELAVDGGQDPSVYLDPPILALVKKWQAYIAIHAVGESTAGDDTAWASEAKQAVGRLRDAGVTCPLYVMSRVYGRSLTCLLNKGAEVKAADPLRNVIFGWQAYWGLDANTTDPMNSMDGHYQRENGMTLAQAIDRCAAATFPVQVGLMHHSDPTIDAQQVIPYRDMMKALQGKRLGWLWWDYREGPDDLTQSGTFGDWTSYGTIVVKSGAGLMAAARSPFLISQRV